MTDQTTQATYETRQREGKYLSFVLAEEEYGLEILKVREIIGVMNITAVPRTPEFIKGVINLRGKVIPVVNLRLKFGISEGMILAAGIGGEDIFMLSADTGAKPGQKVS